VATFVYWAFERRDSGEITAELVFRAGPYSPVISRVNLCGTRRRQIGRSAELCTQ
jgi:hypothetical protein